MIDKAILEHSLIMTRESFDQPSLSRLEFLSEYIFDFTTYDSEMSELFASKAVVICKAISERSTYQYIKESPDNYRWFLLMVNMPFFVNRLDWGTSICGCWWELSERRIFETTGIFINDKQITSIKFSRDEWIQFISAICEFAASEQS